MASKRYRRWMAIGCSHGSLADPHAVEAALRFKRRWKPEIRIHLGDLYDFAAFRSGARGTKDEAEELGPDIKAGAELIKAFAPTDILLGNHDIRVWKLASHPNAILRHAAGACINEFHVACEKAKVKRIVEKNSVLDSYIKYGDCTFLHGWMFNVNAIRDHAESWGKCVIAHLHRTGVERARRSDHAVGYCVGTLTNVPNMDYALARRATLAWSHGFTWGETSDTECIVNLAECQPMQAANWRLPL